MFYIYVDTKIKLKWEALTIFKSIIKKFLAPNNMDFLQFTGKKEINRLNKHLKSPSKQSKIYSKLLNKDMAVKMELVMIYLFR